MGHQLVNLSIYFKGNLQTTNTHDWVGHCFMGKKNAHCVN